MVKKQLGQMAAESRQVNIKKGQSPRSTSLIYSSSLPSVFKPLTTSSSLPSSPSKGNGFLNEELERSSPVKTPVVHIKKLSIEGNRTKRSSSAIIQRKSSFSSDYSTFSEGSKRRRSTSSRLSQIFSPGEFLESLYSEYIPSQSVYLLLAEDYNKATLLRARPSSHVWNATVDEKQRIKVRISLTKKEHVSNIQTYWAAKVIDFLNEPFQKERSMEMLRRMKEDSIISNFCSSHISTLEKAISSQDVIYDRTIESWFCELPNTILKTKPIINVDVVKKEQHLLIDLERTLVDSFIPSIEILNFIAQKRREHWSDKKIISQLPSLSTVDKETDQSVKKTYPELPDFITCEDYNGVVRFVYIRPKCMEFLSYCFKRFSTVSIFSEYTRETVHEIVQLVFESDTRLFYKCFTRNDCEYIKGKYYKPLNVIMEKEGIYFNRSNMLLIDDSKDVCRTNYGNCLRLPEYYAERVLHKSDSRPPKRVWGGKNLPMLKDRTLSVLAKYLETIRGQDLSQLSSDKWVQGSECIVPYDEKVFYKKLKGTNPSLVPKPEEATSTNPTTKEEKTVRCCNIM